jgi:hypothetical protein
MSRAPRIVVPGTVQATTRRTNRLEARMLVNPQIRAAFKYILAAACKEFGVLLVAFSITPAERMLFYVDVLANTPEFEKFVNRHLAGYVNCIQGMTGQMFDNRSYDRIVAADRDALFELAAMVLARPAELGLCSNPSDFEDMVSSVGDLGE